MIPGACLGVILSSILSDCSVLLDTAQISQACAQHSCAVGLLYRDHIMKNVGLRNLGHTYGTQKFFHVIVSLICLVV